MGLFSRLFSQQKPRRTGTAAAPTTASRVPHSTSTPSSGPVFAVVDVETTGLSPRAHRILELAIVRLDAGGRVIDEWAQRFYPEGPVGATHIHGITDDDVAGAPRFAELLPSINLGLSGTVIVAHNARFDVGFLSAEYARAGWDLPEVPTLCTMNASRHYLPMLDRRRLVDCCAAAGVRLDGAHSALGDARATSQVFASWLHRQPALPDLAVGVGRRTATSWPSGPTREPMRLAAPRPPIPRRPKPVPTSLGPLLRKLRFTSELPEGAPGRFETEQYVEKLLEVLEDGVLDPEELTALADLADVYNLGQDTVADAHRTMVEALVLVALIDGKISRAERDEIARLSGQLAVAESDLPAIYTAQRERRLAIIESTLLPLPTGWTGGEPLHVGAKIVFTGGSPDIRTQLENLAAQQGLEVMKSVSRFTTLLVSDGIDSASAREAQQRGTRTVTYREAVDLIRYTQPRA